MIKNRLSLRLATLCALIPTAALAQQLDLSRAEFTPDGADAVIVNGFQLPDGNPGDKNERYKARFRWVPEKKALFLEPASLEKIGAVGSGSCRIAYLQGPGDNAFVFSTNPTAEGEFGGMLNQQHYQKFAASWFKGPIKANPYLMGKDVKDLKDGNAYGIIGGIAKSYKGFWTGQLIEVTGSVEKGGFQMRALDTGAVAAFSPRGGQFWKGTTCTLLSGNYQGDAVETYTLNVAEASAGGARLSFPPQSQFDVTWNRAWSTNPSVMLGSIGASTVGSGFSPGDRAFVTPLGFGFAVTAVGADGGAKTTATMLTRPR